MKSFERWTIDEVEREFHLTEQRQHPKLLAWLESAPKLTPEEIVAIEPYRALLEENAYFWNEEELKIRCIGPLLEQVKFDNHRYKSFFERSLKAMVNGETLSGIVDFMVASGKGVPQEPYFFLQEYKPQRGRVGDPLAQVLVAMVAATSLNSSLPHTLYGGYVIGRQWFFLILSGDSYSISKGFDASQNDVFQIVAILKRAKEYIEEILAARH
ncbi:MAG: hypothetical protein MUF71_10540 [Candidatus Kapabacteria bacterium]|jgi:hypothetical protein|nr:hypothetical protein [Candidatus Kapabacteria bacterium]